ncbi:hypothetical protein [Deinococcus gobiensis]|uniref:Double-GTPase 1 domain-containing protein n=1 Tax=Deinococcus gobiensis (strain DSM 21396 / JCM 16679 / CGMCC 1.7299 / I-0) TaxID=745776 RepID=H8H2Y3_DEIGI|nr:hypothetical protein [Deinococcus gobiensis]AFD27880.1 hypothetical protein DGo_PC0088 [Deinococcus gobiensis I-0]
MTNLLIAGASKAGKTVYGAQFYLRTQAGAALTSKGEAEDLSIFHKAIEAIAHGRKPERTKDEESRTLTLEVSDAAGRTTEMLWPDYAGESFADLLKRRVFTEEWLTRVKDATGLLLLIRPEVTAMPADALKSRRKGQGRKSTTTSSSPSADEKVQDHLVPLLPDAQYVEWVQMMRHLRGEGRLERSRWPLVVLLTCWDELKDPKTPAEVLQHKCPLLASYLRGIWAPEALAIYGVSALGQAFDDRKGHVNTTFLAERPERQGYVICPTGAQDSDLTLPVAWLLKRLHDHQD